MVSGTVGELLNTMELRRIVLCINIYGFEQYDCLCFYQEVLPVFLYCSWNIKRPVNRTAGAEGLLFSEGLVFCMQR